MNTLNTVVRFCKSNVDVLFVLVLTSSVFYYIFLKCGYDLNLGYNCGSHDSDVPYHVHFAQLKLINGDLLKGNFLLYLMVVLFSGFSKDYFVLGLSMSILLGMAEATTFVLYKTNIKQYLVGSSLKMSVHSSQKTDRIFGEGVPHIGAAAMLFVYVIPYLYLIGLLGFHNLRGSNMMYSPYYVPNVWHNSTIIFSMPFSLGLFFLSEKALKECRKDIILKMCIVASLGVFVKPSFFFIFLIGFPVVAFVRYRFDKDFFRCMLPVIVGCFSLVYVFISIYGEPSDGSSVFVDFSRLLQFDVIQIYRMMASLAFPVLFVVFRWKVIGKDLSFLYVMVLLISAIGIAMVCGETGPRSTHGNMSWQVVPAMQLTYYYILRSLMTTKVETRRELSIRNLIMVLFSLHVVSGVWYLVRYLVVGEYR